MPASACAMSAYTGRTSMPNIPRKTNMPVAAACCTEHAMHRQHVRAEFLSLTKEARARCGRHDA